MLRTKKTLERDVHFCGWSIKDMKGLTSGELLDEHGFPNIAVEMGERMVGTDISTVTTRRTGQ
jgi:hypothetical protein